MDNTELLVRVSQIVIGLMMIRAVINIFRKGRETNKEREEHGKEG